MPFNLCAVCAGIRLNVNSTAALGGLFKLRVCRYPDFFHIFSFLMLYLFYENGLS